MTEFAMRAIGGGHGYCEHCQLEFAQTIGRMGVIRHPTFDEWPDIHPALAEKFKSCPNAGKTFKFAAMEEVDDHCG